MFCQCGHNITHLLTSLNLRVTSLWILFPGYTFNSFCNVTRVSICILYKKHTTFLVALNKQDPHSDIIKLWVRSSALLNRAAPGGRLNATKANCTRAKPVWKRATVDHFPMWSRACQSKPYRATMSAWTQSQTVPHWYATCHAQGSGAKYTKRVPRWSALVHFPQECLNAHEANHPGTVRLGTAQHGTVRFKKCLIAAMNPQQ